jgi:hypothetical protein
MVPLFQRPDLGSIALYRRSGTAAGAISLTIE